MKHITALLVLLVAATAIGGEQNPVGNSPEEEMFLNPSLLKIYEYEKDTKWERASKTTASRKKKSTHYLIRLKNQNKTELTGLRVDYCIYRDRKINGDEFIEIDSHRKEIAPMMPFSTEEVKTVTGKSYKVPEDGFINEIVGCCFRVYMTLPNGREIMREKRSPSSLSTTKYPWKEPEDNRGDHRNTSENGKEFMNPSSFTITTKTTETKWKEDDGKVDGREKKETHYRITLENKSSVKITGLRMDCCIYRDRKNSKGEYISTDSYSKEIGTITPSGTENATTGVKVSSKVPDSGFLNEVLGIRAKIYLPMEDEQEIVREIQLPESLSEEKHPWQDPEEKK